MATIKQFLTMAAALFLAGGDFSINSASAQPLKKNVEAKSENSKQLDFIVNEGTVTEGSEKDYDFNQADLAKYQTWIKETIEYSKANQTPAIIIDKKDCQLKLYQNGGLVKEFKIELGFNPYEDKKREGDGATPEGKYKVKMVKDKGRTLYYRAFWINYPNSQDWKEFFELKRRKKLPRKATIGGNIEIHGGGPRGKRWTRGCIALSDRDMDFLFEHVKKGTPVTIVRYDNKD